MQEMLTVVQKRDRGEQKSLERRISALAVVNSSRIENEKPEEKNVDNMVRPLGHTHIFLKQSL